MGERAASMSGSPSRARLSRVERPAGMAARLCSTSPPCFLRCRPTRASTTARWSASRSPRATRWSARAPGLVQGPGLEGGDELGLVDQAVLKGEQSEEQVAVGVDGGHGTGLRDVGPGRGHSVLNLGGHHPIRDPDRLDYCMTKELIHPGMPGSDSILGVRSSSEDSHEPSSCLTPIPPGPVPSTSTSKSVSETGGSAAGGWASRAKMPRMRSSRRARGQVASCHAGA